MDASTIYHIKLNGSVNISAFNSGSPLQTLLTRSDPAVTYLAARTDQAGLIGLLRYIHQTGYVLLSVHKEQIKCKKPVIQTL